MTRRGSARTVQLSSRGLACAPAHRHLRNAARGMAPLRSAHRNAHAMPPAPRDVRRPASRAPRADSVVHRTVDGDTILVDSRFFLVPDIQGGFLEGECVNVSCTSFTTVFIDFLFPWLPASRHKMLCQTGKTKFDGRGRQDEIDVMSLLLIFFLINILEPTCGDFGNAIVAASVIGEISLRSTYGRAPRTARPQDIHRKRPRRPLKKILLNPSPPSADQGHRNFLLQE